MDWTITLWLGLDGLQIAPDGASEWIRREPEPPRGYRNIGHPSIPGPSYWLPTPPPPDTVVLYADNQAVLTTCCAASTQSLRAPLDALKMEAAAAECQVTLQRGIAQAQSFPPCSPVHFLYSPLPQNFE